MTDIAAERRAKAHLGERLLLAFFLMTFGGFETVTGFLRLSVLPI